MDCQQATDLLSAYFDQELTTDVKTEVAQHLAECEACAAELAGFGELSAMAKSLSHPVPPAHIWNNLEAQLLSRPNDDATTWHSRGRLFRVRHLSARAAFAAAALVLIAFGWFGYTLSSHRDEHEMAIIFGQYLDRFQTDPRAAQDILLTSYQSREVTADQARDLVGYRPVVGNGLPQGYTVMSTHVMKMPCCTCVQCLCQRADGTLIAIFEHDDDEPNWYGDLPSTNEVCSGTRCSLVRLDSRLAATWQRGKRHISVIGARDTEEISQLVAWFDERRTSHVSFANDNKRS